MSEEAALTADTTTEPAATTETPTEQGAGGEGHWADALPEEYRESMQGFDSFEAVREALKGPEIPEAYAAPEGLELDASTFESFGTIAKEAGLTQAQVNAIAKFDVERMAKLPDMLREHADAQMQEGLKQMASELGKEKYDTSLRLANNTLKQFADESIGKWLQDSGMGNSPQLVKLLAKIGERLAEDSPTTANLQGNKSKTPEQTMYPDMK